MTCNVFFDSDIENRQFNVLLIFVRTKKGSRPQIESEREARKKKNKYFVYDILIFLICKLLL